jgi:hypothetical protein
MHEHVVYTQSFVIQKLSAVVSKTSLIIWNYPRDNESAMALWTYDICRALKWRCHTNNQ